MVVRFRKDGTLYSFILEDIRCAFAPYLIMVATTADSEKVVRVPVRDVGGFSIKINKKSMSAAGGARGAFAFIANCIHSDFMMDWVYKIIAAFL